MTTLEQAALGKGFASLEEFSLLVASVDLRTGERFAAFKEWQENDGTKAGLLRLLGNGDHD